MAPRTLKLPSSYEVQTSVSERLVAAIGRNVVVADLQKRKRLWSAHPFAHPSSAAFSNSEKALAVKSTWGEVAVLDAESGDTLVSTRPKAQDEGSAVHFAGADQFVVDGSWSGNILVRQVSDLSVIARFHFENEMIGSVSSNADGEVWLFAHKPKAIDSPKPRKPYVTLWEWPLREPKTEIDAGLDILYAAELAPSGEHIAVIGLNRTEESRQLRVLTRCGSVIAKTQVTPGGTGSRLRWSPDSSLIGTVGKGEFLTFAAKTLAPLAQFKEPYPSDVAFIQKNTALVLGSWTAGCIVSLPTPSDA